MKITLQGQDYTTALEAGHPLTIERKLNEPAICRLWLALPATGALAVPARGQSLSVAGDDGAVYFTGYLAATPFPDYVGIACEGPRYRYALEAISDEILLDQALIAPGKGASGQTAGQILTSLVTHTGSNALSTQPLTHSSLVGDFIPEPGASFSKCAGQAADQVRATYRAQSGALTLASIPAAVHTLNAVDGSLALGNLSLSGGARRLLANDITVCGEHEPAAYVTEYFLGDGAATQFDLSAAPYFPPTSKETLISEAFNEPGIDLTRWTCPGGGYFSLSPSGLAMSGGNGVDGKTRLAWIDTVEMGGTLLLEASGLTLANASTGILAAFFSGLPSVAGCIAGFQATAQQGTGAVSLQPIVLGNVSGATYNISPTSQYTLRLRIHCPEQQRTLASYTSCGDDGLIFTGGQSILAPAKLHFEIQPFVNGVAGMPVTLYDGSIANLPAACTVIAASSLNLQGTLRALHLRSLGSAWVVGTPSGGSPCTRRIGTVTEAAECHVERTGKLVFYTGFAPAIGEQLAVSYRTIGRAVGRATNAASVQAIGQSAWIGAVTQPAARSSADCRNAASALAQAAASTSALWSGTYKSTQLSLTSDIWPGDALQLNAPSISLNGQVVVRAVKLTYTPAIPDLVHYEITFANDWADDLAIKTSAAVPADAWLPAPIAPTMLANLTSLTVTALTGSTVTVNSGIAPPQGGGFEIRRRDANFQPSEDPDLVMRGAQQTSTFSRISANDRFYIRMYDGSTPLNYSEFSVALFINLPLGS